MRDIAARLGTELKIEILDWADTAPTYVIGPDITVRDMTGKTMRAPSGYFSFVRNADLVIDIGGGDSFSDIYGPQRLRMMFWLKYLAHIAGTPLVLGPQTYGPFTKALSKFLTRGTLKRSVIVASRDQTSTQIALEIAPGIEVIEASDVALRLPHDPPAPRAPGGRPRVGLNVSGLLMRGGYTGKNMFGLKADYGAMIRTLIGRLHDHAETPEVHLVSHVITPDFDAIENDQKAAVELQKEFPDVIVAPAFGDPSEAKTYIAGLDFFAGARMHACIAAFSSGVPVVPMAYSRKFEGLFGTLGYNRTVDCTTEAAETIIDAVMGGFEARATLVEEMKPAFAQGLEKLGHYEAALEAQMSRILARKG
ncbi:MAG: polysaccharide pyruvyl transferase family protein [Pseudomonadota bacterium]